MQLMHELGSVLALLAFVSGGAFANDSQCVPTGGTVSDGHCHTSDSGCCDLASECLDDGTCELPLSVCTTDSTCDDAEDFCAGGFACVSPDDVDLTSYDPGTSPYLGVVQYESQEFFLVGTGNLSSDSFVVNEIVSFDEELGANVHVVLDESGRPLSAYPEGYEDEEVIFVYDRSGNLVSAVEADDGDSAGERRLVSLQDSTLVLHGRQLPWFIPVIVFLVRAIQLAKKVRTVIKIIEKILDIVTPDPTTSTSSDTTTSTSTTWTTPTTDTTTSTSTTWTTYTTGSATGDPHMQGLRGQKINWSGVDGGWYSLVKDDDADININLRVTAPLPDEFPDRQLITSLAVMSEGHSLVIEVENPYATDTDGCPENVSPCLANGGLRVFVDGQKADALLRFSRQLPVADGAISVSASNLPVECRQFGGHKIWGRMYQEMLEGRRQLANRESFEDWILKSDHMPAPGWCAKYIAENDLADMQSTHAIFKIETPTLAVRLDAGVNHQGDGELHWDGRVLPDLEFWQMDVVVDGLDVENPALSGLLGETARPMYDENGKEVKSGFEAFRGTVEDYRVSSALGVHFPLLHKQEKEEGQQ